ncbi:DUF1772 domain-containing protein [Pseudonocardia sp. CA-107938]|uniref:anthrone oxygenase family protein n=1 Tax=Pseudonocardia sp. CA-107938 TaxID=3240021 RepID=UPI003D9486D3
MTILRTLVLLAATLSVGVGAGAYALYAHTVMPGLGTTDDRTFIGAFQAMDRAILNPWFLGGSFVGSLVLGALAALLCLGRPELPWIAAAVALHVVLMGVTMAVNVPLNDALKAAGPPDALADPAAVRAAFDAARWEAWNKLRVALSVASFALLAWSLVLHGRTDAVA